eukprot:2928915-Pyramimonas_sp.AAC.1
MGGRRGSVWRAPLRQVSKVKALLARVERNKTQGRGGRGRGRGRDGRGRGRPRRTPALTDCDQGPRVREDGPAPYSDQAPESHDPPFPHGFG